MQTRCCRARGPSTRDAGYVQSDDVVNAGFIQGQESFVRVAGRVRRAVTLDNYEGVDITRLNQGGSSEEPV